MQEHKDNRVKEYNKAKLVIGIVGFILQMAFLQVILLTGLSSYSAGRVSQWVSNSYLSMLIYTVILVLIDGILIFPMDVYSGFILEHKYSLSNQSFGRWLWEETKAALVSFFIMLLPILLALYYCVRRFGDLWWLPVAVLVFLFTVVISELAPVLIMPIFYKFSPIEDEGLSERLRKLAERSGLKVRGVFSFNMSKNTKKANAALAGLGRTRRIILSDTLLENFSADEIESVFAHEMGHHRHRHIWKSIVISSVNIFVGLFALAYLYRVSLNLYGFQSLDSIAALPLLGFYLGIFGVVVLPLGNIVSRFYERQADRYAIREADRAAFISAMSRLADLNMGDKTPNPVVEFLFYSHPSIGKRIKMAEQIIN